MWSNSIITYDNQTDHFSTQGLRLVKKDEALPLESKQKNAQSHQMKSKFMTVVKNASAIFFDLYDFVVLIPTSFCPGTYGNG